MNSLSQKRLEMGEVAWQEYQTQRNRAKSKTYREKNVKKVCNSRRKKKERLVEYKGGKCERCEFKTDFMSCYDFHHKDPTTKDFGLGGGGKNLSFERCKEEVDKCMLVCKNCHAIIHEEIINKKHGVLV